MKRSTLPALPACVLGAGLAFAAAAPAQAPPPAAPAVTLDRTCYAPGDPITQAGHGFTPGAEVLETLSLLPPDGAPNPLAVLSATRVADAAGNFAVQIRAPELARDADRREIAGSAFVDQSTVGPPPAPGTPPGPPTLSATVTWTLSAWEADVPQWQHGTADPRRSMTVDAFGWTVAGKTLYAHYYRGTTRVR